MSRYRNAKDVLPDHLVREIQKYVRGQHLYIPQTERAGWGEKTGIRDELEQRNKEIAQKFVDGVSVSRLADIYHLSEDRIRTIVYEHYGDE
ncbi:CD3324 family protein [Paenibacillus sp. GYB003]|uniref:CD3324 family protein n=1 Tax=Paenibacillus sp. GYB003 TaxID=2994392 RepID=UPI002F963F16